MDCVVPGSHPVADIITYNALSRACEKGQQPERALEVSEAMQQLGAVPDVHLLCPDQLLREGQAARVCPVGV